VLGVDEAELNEDVQRLEELLQRRGRIAAEEYIALIRRIGRARPERLINLGDQVFSFGLQQAFLDGDVEALVAVALIVASVLDATGLHGQAIARLDQAAVMISDDSEGLAKLLAAQASYQAFAGRIEGARGSMLAFLHAMGEPEHPAVSAEIAHARSIILDLSETETLAAATRRARNEGHGAHASSLFVQLISSQVAFGQIADAAVAARDLVAFAAGERHPARQVDAEVALVALRSRQERAEAPERLAAEAERLLNNHALWKLLVSEFRQLVIRADLGGADQAHDLLLTHYDWMNPGYHNSFAGLEAYRAALFGERERVGLPAPDAPTLASVGNVLASAEAVALGGTLSAAADWVVWLEEELPPYIVSSLEWPACRARVEALLYLRLGQRSEAVARLEVAIECCEARGDAIEAEIGRAQLAAITEDGHSRALAAARLLDIGIDASCFSLAAARVAERVALAGDPALSVNEARVLGRLARGLSHREIEADMGLKPRGASRVLGASYEKLGVRGRVAAVQAARERLIA
jgi:DNA-binding CsgD family transcriptional regulator